MAIEIVRSEFFDQGVKNKDLELWEKWNKSRSHQDLDALFNRMNRIIYMEVQRQLGSLPPIYMELKAKEYAKQAFEKYDPKRGVALSTHLVNYLKQLSRLNATYRQAARIPEHQQKYIVDFKAKKDSLIESLGRNPTIEELSEKLKLNNKIVATLDNALRSEFSDALEVSHQTESEFSTGADVDPMVVFFYQGLSPEDKRLFEYTTGYGGKPILSNSALSKELKINYSQLSYKKRILIDKLKRTLGRV